MRDATQSYRQDLSSILSSPKTQRRCNTAAWALFLSILVFGSLPGAREDIGQLASGAVLHSLAYAILGALTFVGGKGDAAWRALGATLKVAVMGAVDECVQGLFPYRTAAITDWLIDVVAGAVVSLLLWKLWPKVAQGNGPPSGN